MLDLYFTNNNRVNKDFFFFGGGEAQSGQKGGDDWGNWNIDHILNYTNVTMFSGFRLPVSEDPTIYFLKAFYRDPIGRQSSMGRFCFTIPHKHFWHYLEPFLVVAGSWGRGGLLLASSVWRPGLPLNMYTTQEKSPAPTTKNHLPKRSIATRWRNPDLRESLVLEDRYWDFRLN